MVCHLRVAALDLSYSWKSYQRQIFQGLNLCIESGSFVSIIGSNGSGKTSLFKLILGLIAPQSGTIELADMPVVPGQVTAVKAGQLAYLAQHIEELFFADRVRDELNYDQPHQTEKSQQIIQALGLPDLLSRQIATLSGGERQSLALAQFVSSTAPLLILDEPSSYLDAKRCQLLEQFLGAAHAEGRTILHATQYPEELNWGTHYIDLDVLQPVVVPVP